MSDFKPLARKNDIVIQEMNGEILIFDLKINKAFNLNETSALIWQLADGDKTVSEIADELSRKFDFKVSEEFVWLALERLQKESLVKNQKEITGFFAKVSRREIIKRVGLATIIALPTVFTLVAPLAVNAQSGCVFNNNANQDANGCACNSNSDCTSSCCSGPATPRICITARDPAFTVPRCGVCTVNCQCPSGDNCITMTSPDVCNAIGTPPDTPCI
jgi:hypothetical protein